MATYALQSPVHAGSQIAFVQPPASNDIAPCGAGMGLLVVNPAGGTITVSLPLPSEDGITVASRVVSIPASTTELIPLPSSVYGPSVTLTYTGTLTNVQVAVISSPAT